MVLINKEHKDELIINTDVDHHTTAEAEDKQVSISQTLSEQSVTAGKWNYVERNSANNMLNFRSFKFQICICSINAANTDTVEAFFI